MPNRTAGRFADHSSLVHMDLQMEDMLLEFP